MIQIAADFAKLYTSFMEQKGLETDQHRYYIKWLRYYLLKFHVFFIRPILQMPLLTGIWAKLDLIL